MPPAAPLRPEPAPGVDEAQALRGAYDRAVAENGRTSLGRAINADQIPAALEKFVRITDGQAWDQVGFSAPLMKVTTDIRAYYEELAVGLVDGGPIAAWGTERVFYNKTEAGKVLQATREEPKKDGAPSFFGGTWRQGRARPIWSG